MTMNQLKDEISLVKNSGFFDSAWYLSQYKDVKQLDIDPAEHYLTYGAEMLRDPSTKFSTRTYLLSNLDVRQSGMNPLLHFLRFGQKEGRPATRHDTRMTLPTAEIDIVVPVFNALPDVKLCLESINGREDGCQVRVFVVNDGSNEETTAWLRAFCDGKMFVLIEHPHNLGYTRAVNTGLRATTASYVITLNSDTIVTTGWLKGLLRCINSSPDIGIAGPLSNAASWQNVPQLFEADGTFAVNELRAGDTPDSMARIVARVSRRAYPKVPFVNGFCFMIKRAVLDAVGFMDEENFPVGYGEENDFCIRAADAGFLLAIADDTYVFHAKSKSFGHAKRKELSQQGSATLKRKHTAEKFDALVKKIRNTKPLDALRSAVRAELVKKTSLPATLTRITPLKVLFILPVRGGGGGGHSVIQEASEMRRLGVAVHVAVKKQDLDHVRSQYTDIADIDSLIIGYTDPEIIAEAEDYDVVVATVYTSVELVRRICEVHQAILPAYYVQDYEPLFFNEGNSDWQIAYDSYTKIPNAMLFAKTQWLVDTVRASHNLFVHKVEPSIDHEVYRTVPRERDDKIRLSAMIRPQTPRRGAERTMRLLSKIWHRHSGNIEIQLFGCPENDTSFDLLSKNFGYKNMGVLNRPEVAALLGRSDFFIDLSDYQAFGRTALEAMACGCAAMVPVYGGTDEYAIDGVNALIVDVYDENECFRRLDALLRSPAELYAMQLAGLRTAAKYSVHAAAMSELTAFAVELATHRTLYPRRTKPSVVVVPTMTGKEVRHPTGSAFVRLLRPYLSQSLMSDWRVSVLTDDSLPVPGSAEIAILQRDVKGLPLNEITVWMQDWHTAGGKVVWEVDDDLFDSAALRQRHVRGDVELLVEKVRWLASNADAVTVSTEQLAKKIGNLNENISVVPNLLDESLWRLPQPRNHAKQPYGRTPDGPVRIGYIGTPSHTADMRIIEQVMLDLQNELGDRILVEAIGVFQNSPATFGRRVALPKKADYPHFVNWLHERVHWDIGIIPLDDDEFNKSKSNLKFLEYAALNMAIVCSDVESYRGVAINERNCLVAENTYDAWYDAIKRLVEDVEMRLRLASAARAQIVQDFLISSHASLYSSILSRVLNEVENARAD
jgi:GT2 family glycosyltransferase/glycosyltransferase involved in cell wall biosynthesis